MKYAKIKIIKHDDLNSLQQEGRTYLNGFSSFRFLLTKWITLPDLFQDYCLNFYNIGIVISGCLEMMLDGKLLKFNTNDIFFAAPNSSLKLISLSGDCVIEGLSFNAHFFMRSNLPEKITDIMESFALKCTTVLSTSSKEKRLLVRLVSKIRTRILQIDNHPYGNELLVNSFSEYLIEISAAVKKFGFNDGFEMGRKEELVLAFVKLAKEKFHKERQITFYSSQLSVTAKHLSETVKKVAGKTAGELLDELSLQEAKRLLSHTQSPIAAIAGNLQLSNPGNFSRFFYHYEGISPRQYRSLKSYNNK